MPDMGLSLTLVSSSECSAGEPREKVFLTTSMVLFLFTRKIIPDMMVFFHTFSTFFRLKKICTFFLATS